MRQINAYKPRDEELVALDGHSQLSRGFLEKACAALQVWGFIPG